jgi:hypothetical protein
MSYVRPAFDLAGRILRRTVRPRSNPFFGLVVLTLVLGAATASAQPSEEDRAVARAAFERGLAAAQAGDWEEANRAFEEAYGRVPLPAILLNLAGAQRQTGRLVEAERSYGQFLAMASGSDAESRPAAERALVDVRAEVPHARITIENLLNGDRVLIDGGEVPNAALSTPVAINPGAHRVEVQRDGESVASETFSVERGGSTSVALRAPAREAESNPIVGPITEEPDDGGSNLGLIVLFSGLGAAVVAGVIITVVLLTGGPPDPFMGNFGPGHVEVR